MRGRAVAARRAHNPEVAGSSPAPATEKGTLKVSFLLKVKRNQQLNLRPSGYKPYRGLETLNMRYLEEKTFLD